MYSKPIMNYLALPFVTIEHPEASPAKQLANLVATTFGTIDHGCPNGFQAKMNVVIGGSEYEVRGVESASGDFLRLVVGATDESGRVLLVSPSECLFSFGVKKITKKEPKREIGFHSRKS